MSETTFIGLKSRWVRRGTCPFRRLSRRTCSQDFTSLHNCIPYNLWLVALPSIFKVSSLASSFGRRMSLPSSFVTKSPYSFLLKGPWWLHLGPIWEIHVILPIWRSLTSLPNSFCHTNIYWCQELEPGLSLPAIIQPTTGVVSWRYL